MSHPSTMDPLVRDALLDGADDAPPMPYTSADLIRAGRRSLRRQRAVSAAGGVLGAAAVVTAVVALVPSLGRAPEAPRYSLPAGTPLWTVLEPDPFCATAAVPATEPDSPPMTVTNTKNGYQMVMPTEPTAHASARLSCFLLATVPQYVSGASFAITTEAPDGSVPLQVYAGREFDPGPSMETAPPFLTASAVLVDAAGTGSIGFSVMPTSQSAADAAANCGLPPCTVRSGPAGEVITVLEVSGSDPNPEMRLLNVWVHKGGTTVAAFAMNGVSSAEPGTVNAPMQIGREDLPISVDDLVEILLAPELTLFP